MHKICGTLAEMTKTTFGIALGHLILQKRKAKGLTQLQLAEDAFGTGTRTRRISELENGQVANPHPTTIDPIYSVLGITEDEIEECAKLSAYKPDADLDRAYREARNLIEIIAYKFNNDRPNSTLAELEDFLKEKSKEYHRLKEKITAIEGPKGKIDILKSNAMEALANGDFESVDNFLIEAEELQLQKETLVQIRKQAKIRVTRGSVCFINSDLEKALELYLSAAEFLKPFSESEMNNLLQELAGQIYELSRRGYEATFFIAIALLERAAELDIYQNDMQIKAGVNYKLSLIYRNASLEKTSNEKTELCNKAIEYAKVAIALAQDFGTIYELAAARGILGNCLLDKGKEQSESRYFEECISVLSQNKTDLEKNGDFPILLGQACNSLGACISSFHKFKKKELTEHDIIELRSLFKQAIDTSEKSYNLETWSAAQINYGIYSHQLASLYNDDHDKGHVLRVQSISAYLAALEAYPSILFPEHAGEINFLLAKVIDAHSSSFEGQMFEGYLLRTIQHLFAASEYYTPEKNIERWTEINLHAGIIFIKHAGLKDSPARRHDYEQAKSIFIKVKQENNEENSDELFKICDQQLIYIDEKLAEL